MSGCLDNVACGECIDLGERRNTVASIVSGAFFFTGWWVIIGVAAVYPNQADFNNAYYTCGVIGTLSMFMINAVSNSQVRGDAVTNGLLGTRGARLWLLMGFVLGFGAFIASMWILFQAYVVDKIHQDIKPGICLFVENLFIIIGSLIYKFGRTEDLWGS